ncbi:MAG: hypothetical protein NTX36_07435 [Proteobacteria bacterium]|nr:hypothetical protein [Pseudomonadota bacterium]
MPICKYCFKDTEDPKTTTCIPGYIEYQDNASLHRVPHILKRKKDVLSVMFFQPVYTIGDVIWRDVQDVVRRLFPVDA